MYATGHAMNTNEIMRKFPTKKLKMTAKECEEMIKNRHKEVIARDVFRACVALVVDDIINNNVSFELPTRAKKSSITMKRFEGDDFIKCRQNGKFQDVNFINSNFSGYQMVFKYQTAGVHKEKPIYLDSRHKDKITKRTNEGKVYYT